MPGRPYTFPYGARCRIPRDTVDRICGLAFIAVSSYVVAHSFPVALMLMEPHLGYGGRCRQAIPQPTIDESRHPGRQLRGQAPGRVADQMRRSVAGSLVESPFIGGPHETCVQCWRTL